MKIVSIQKFNDERKVEFYIDSKLYSFTTSLIGKIQIKNLLLAILAAYLSKVKIQDILSSIKKLNQLTEGWKKLAI